MVKKLSRQLRIAATLIALGLAKASEALAVGVETGPSNRQWLELCAKRDATPVYDQADTSSPILYRLGAGRCIEVRRDPREIETAKRIGWIQITQDESLSVHERELKFESARGWLKISDYHQVSDFQPVRQWPFRYLIEEQYPFVIANCFSKDGQVVQFVRGEGSSDRSDWRLFIAGDIVAIGKRSEAYKGAGVLAYWNRKLQRLCPPGMDKLQCDDFYLNSEKYSFEWRIGLFAATGGRKDEEKFRMYCTEEN